MVWPGEFSITERAEGDLYLFMPRSCLERPGRRTAPAGTVRAAACAQGRQGRGLPKFGCLRDGAGHRREPHPRERAHELTKQAPWTRPGGRTARWNSRTAATVCSTGSASPPAEAGGREEPAEADQRRQAKCTETGGYRRPAYQDVSPNRHAFCLSWQRGRLLRVTVQVPGVGSKRLPRLQ